MLMKPTTRPLSRANLPENTADVLLVSGRASECRKALINKGFRVLPVADNDCLRSSISSHPDMRYMYFGHGVLFTDNIADTPSEIKDKFDNTVIRENLTEAYPGDARLNCVTLGKYFICNEKSVSKTILDFAYKSGLEIIFVNQGYTKCSICILNENAIITDDKSIYTAAQNFLNDVTFISKGSIRLKGMNYGFIGGCTGKLSKNEIAFSGRIESHDNHNDIYDSLIRNNITAAELTDGPLEDIGSIIPLTEHIQPDF